MENQQVSAKVLAEVLGLSVTRVHQLAKEGVIEQIAKARYDLPTAVQAYIKYVSYGKATADRANDRQRLEAAKARREELAVQKMEGELLPREQVRVALNEHAAAIIANIDAIPGRLASELAGVTEPAVIRQRLFDELSRGRNAVSDRLARLGVVGRSGGAVEGEVKANPGQVGKRGKGTTSRKRGTRSVAK